MCPEGPRNDIFQYFAPGLKFSSDQSQIGVSQKGSPERCSLPIFSVFFRFLPFSSVFSLFSFRFLPFFSVFFRLFRFFPFLSVFFPFFPFLSVFFRFFPFLSVFFPFHFQKKTGRHRSRDPFCETPIRLKFSIENETFKASATARPPLLWGILKVRIDILKRMD